MKEEKFVPLEKQSKKAQRRAAAAKRGSWYGVKPVTKIVPDSRKGKLLKLKEKESRDF